MKFKIFLVILIVSFLFFIKTLEAESPTVEEPVKTPCEQYNDIIRSYDWNDDIAIKIMMAESSCNPTAVNNNPRTGDMSIGLMQINILGNLAKDRPTEAELKDPHKNIEFAYKLYTTSGFNPWSTFKRGL